MYVFTSLLYATARREKEGGGGTPMKCK
jgi:hypothetical protein